MMMAQYEAKFTELSRFAPQLITIEEENALKFQDGLKPYQKNKISILKPSNYSEVVDKALITEKDNKELQQYKNNKGRRLEAMVPMVTKHRKGLFQLRVNIKRKRCKILMRFVLFMVRNIRVL